MYDVLESIFPDPRLVELSLLPSREDPWQIPQWDSRKVDPETLEASGSPGCRQPALIWSMAIDGAGGAQGVLPVG